MGILRAELIGKAFVVSLAAWSSIASVACGGTAETPDTNSTDVLAEEDVDSLQQEWGETTCTTTATVHHACGTLGGLGCTATSGTSYTQPSCVDAYITSATLPSGKIGGVEATYNGPLPDGSYWPCNAAWVQYQIWISDTATGPWRIFWEGTAYGESRNGQCWRPSVQQFIWPGRHKVIAKAGFITSFQSVKVFYPPPS